MNSRRIRKILLSTALLASCATACTAAAAQDSGHGGHGNNDIIVENRASLGDGYVQTVYSKSSNGTPTMIGITVDDAAARSLPTLPLHDGNTCFDKDGNGTVDPVSECKSGHERVLWFPKLQGLPFQWMMFNWQPGGHGPEHVFDKPHFDLHFFMQDYYARNAIRTGPCGAVLINCVDNDKALRPVPDPYKPLGFGAPGAAGRMGNHIADLSAPVLNGGPFTQAFVYGTYDAHITFWETVFATDWLKTTKPARDCIPLKWAPQVEQSGFYPRRSCVSYRQRERDYLMTLEDFAYRTAPAGAVAPKWEQSSTVPPGAPEHHGHGTG
ncbi:hypothetical protein [Actinokineospora diospyrosa]|uniref:DUF5602 domain-containing protein n=1 Tax=Actinokineospora diospyrosa TaxID=103728 RepID=A0ABT1IDU1_9PSEU|nr:hypothetical protein [Actinokineospora diospyrosa]MCP2270788.1 hypothetical protein [Actinokineospora diospyrosa]